MCTPHGISLPAKLTALGCSTVTNTYARKSRSHIYRTQKTVFAKYCSKSPTLFTHTYIRYFFHLRNRVQIYLTLKKYTIKTRYFDYYSLDVHFSGVPKGWNSGVRRGVWGFNYPPPEIPKVLQNRAKLNPIVKTVKNC